MGGRVGGCVCVCVYLCARAYFFAFVGACRAAIPVVRDCVAMRKINIISRHGVFCYAQRRPARQHAPNATRSAERHPKRHPNRQAPPGAPNAIQTASTKRHPKRAMSPETPSKAPPGASNATRSAKHHHIARAIGSPPARRVTSRYNLPSKPTRHKKWHLPRLSRCAQVRLPPDAP